MNIEDLFNFEEDYIDPVNMSKDEFVLKTKSLLGGLSDLYNRSWKSRRLLDEEYPSEDICDKCTGCGIFNSDKDCVRDAFEGECYHRYFDSEEFSIEFEDSLDKLYEILFVDNVK